MAEQSTPPHVLIIGAGITGLTLAQALCKRNQADPSRPPITFSIFERDDHPLARGKGWALTLHWALEQFTSLIPQNLIDRLPEAYVDQDAMAKKEMGSFRLYNLQTGRDDFMTPPGDSPRNRFAREKLRRLLMDSLDIQWSKSLVRIQYPDSSNVIAEFSDGTTATGTIIIGCDGSRSQVRRVLCPATYSNSVLPIRMMGATVPYSASKCKKFQDMDRYFFQCCDPATDGFMFFSFLQVPTSEEQEARGGELPLTCQVITSWPYRPGFLGKDEPSNPPEGTAAQLAWMKKMSAGWIEPFKEIVQDMPGSAEVKVISLEDWPPVKGAWDNHGGRVTLIGDAAHAMTMYRGEAANHGIADIRVLLEQILPENQTSDKPFILRDQVDKYESEMIERTNPAVLRSRQACLDAHNYPAVTNQSPLIARRVIVVEKS
ncbi:FAD binding domain-containing protein [Phlyctema vagabunda]|uniref:FAD binding domain-containing protein n=1 Tax=Phlyctema vagabunda TaxID=108571 RepID=A0ABR4PDF4_9HELO